VVDDGQVRRQEQQPEILPRRRLPRLVLVAWVVAAAILAGLAAAVTVHLRSTTSPTASGSIMAGMPGMAGPVSRALYRAGSAEPHGPLVSRALFTAWQLDAVALAVLVLLAAGYLTGVLVVRRRPDGRWPARYTLSFLAGLVVCGLATNSSIAVYDMSLFSAHMIGHLMLVMLAPALMMAGRPLTLLLQATSGRRRERIAAVLTGRVASLLTAPPVALASYTVVIVATHLTGLMDEIMRHTWAGQLEHLAYLLLGCQFFVVVIGNAPIRWRLAAPTRLFMLALSMAVDTFTGIVLMQSTVAITMTPPPGADVHPLADTHTGGAIMWFGGDGIMAAIMLVIAIGWVHRPASQQVEASGWLEQARRASFAQHTGAEERGASDPRGSDRGSEDRVEDLSTEDDFDESDQRLRQYNEWLRRLDSQSHR
jgi:cytochrome c oxidase assembly factor CtaG